MSFMAASESLSCAHRRIGFKMIRAPMPSVVVDVRVQVGDEVKKGQAIVILESMKTETVLRAEKEGRVKSIACSKGEMVEEGRELVVFEDEGTTW